MTRAITIETPRKPSPPPAIEPAARRHSDPAGSERVAAAAGQEYAAPPGSELDWRALYDALGERVFRLAFRMTRDEALAHDITHDTFVRVFEKRDQFSGRGSWRDWVFRIAANLVRERGRTATRRRELLAESASTFPRATPDDTARVDARIVLDEALAELPDDQCIALLLYEVDGFTHAEIGEMLGIAEGSSKARVSRAKAALRAALNGRI
jgi:RNA polymerase sigma-70 factor (ECF subfamily)